MRLFNKLVSVGVPKIERATLGDVASFLWSFARCRMHDDALITQSRERFMKDLQHDPIPQVYQQHYIVIRFIHALSVLNVYDEELLRRAVIHIEFSLKLRNEPMQMIDCIRLQDVLSTYAFVAPDIRARCESLIISSIGTMNSKEVLSARRSTFSFRHHCDSPLLTLLARRYTDLANVDDSQQKMMKRGAQQFRVALHCSKLSACVPKA